MANAKISRKNPRCAIHNIPVIINVPKNEIGNAHGERWFCKKCKGEPVKILISK